MNNNNENIMDNLKNFQKDLEKSLLLAKTDEYAKQDKTYIGVGVLKDHWLLDVSEIIETSSVPFFVKSGRSPSGLIGIASFRGKVMTLVDMQEMLYGEPYRNIEQGWATVLNTNYGIPLALTWPVSFGLVDGRKLLSCAISKGQNSRWVKSCWQDKQGLIWKELNIQTWLIDKGWLDKQALETENE